MQSAFSSQTVPSGQIPGRLEQPTSWFPTKPLTHWPHSKDPGVFMQIEFATQPPLLLLHSLISLQVCLCLEINIWIKVTKRKWIEKWHWPWCVIQTNPWKSFTSGESNRARSAPEARNRVVTCHPFVAGVCEITLVDIRAISSVSG